MICDASACQMAGAGFPIGPASSGSRVPLLDRTAQGVEPTLCALLKWAGAVFDDLCQGLREIEFLADPTGDER